MAKRRKIIGWVLTGFISSLWLIYGAVFKLTVAEWIVAMSEYGLAKWSYVIAAGEVISVLLFLFPKTNKVGLLLLSSYMGGAIMLHMTHNVPIIVPSVFLVLIWITGLIRNPELLRLWNEHG